jgi:transposase InsO family protein
MSLRVKVFWMVEKAKRYKQLVRDSFVEVTDRSAAVGAKRSDNALGLRKRPWITLDHTKLFGTVTHPHNQRASDSSTTIGIVVVTDPEWVAAHFRDDGPTETGTAFFSLDHTKLLRSRSAGVWPRVTGNRHGGGDGIGWDYLHVCVDDASRLACVSIHQDERKYTATRFLIHAVRFFRSHGVQVERVMTDNGNAYRSKTFAKACRWLKLTHKRTRPYTPRTNGKAERFIQTLMRQWAYQQATNATGSAVTRRVFAGRLRFIEQLSRICRELRGPWFRSRWPRAIGSP